MAHRYDEAIERYRKGLEVEPDPMAYFGLVLALTEKGDYATAIRQLEEISKKQGPAPAWHVRPSHYVCPYEVAGVYAQLGNTDQAFKWLDKACQSRSCVYWLRQDPRLDSLHSDPRFQELLAMMKFPQ